MAKGICYFIFLMLGLAGLVSANHDMDAAVFIAGIGIFGGFVSALLYGLLSE